MKLLSALGQRTHLEAKAKGESSMSEKAGRSEAVELPARRGPDGMVKAGLLEP